MKFEPNKPHIRYRRNQWSPRAHWEVAVIERAGGKPCVYNGPLGTFAEACKVAHNPFASWNTAHLRQQW